LKSKPAEKDLTRVTLERDRLLSELARVTAERDAALEALKEIRRMPAPKSPEEASRQLSRCQVLAFSVEHTDSDTKGSD